MAAASHVPHEQLITAISHCVPELHNGSHKGQAGRVGVMGGSREYTGAPYFAAMAAMRMGVDLAYVFCTPAAAPVIKGYSPDLIVMPMLPATQPGLDDNREHIQEAYQYHKKCLGFVERLSVLIIGPGLGDDPQLEWPLEDTVRWVRERNLPLIIDGSGLNFIATRLHLVKGYSNCILTPNIAEFGRLAEGAGVELQGKIGDHWQEQAQELAAALGAPLLLSKGQVDVITDGQHSLVVTADGSPRRCGGQGDILTGTLAAFISWQNGKLQQHSQQSQQAEPAGLQQIPPLMLAAYAGCFTMRAAAVLTYSRRGRSMVAGDMIDALGDPVLQHCGLLPAGGGAKRDSGAEEASAGSVM